MVRINLNEHVRVKLTPYGERLLAESNECYSRPTRNCLGERVFQLWAFMRIFGEHFCNGNDQIIEQNAFVFGDENEHV